MPIGFRPVARLRHVDSRAPLAERLKAVIDKTDDARAQMRSNQFAQCAFDRIVNDQAARRAKLQCLADPLRKVPRRLLGKRQDLLGIQRAESGSEPIRFLKALCLLDTVRAGYGKC